MVLCHEAAKSLTRIRFLDVDAEPCLEVLLNPSLHCRQFEELIFTRFVERAREFGNGEFGAFGCWFEHRRYLHSLPASDLRHEGVELRKFRVQIVSGIQFAERHGASQTMTSIHKALPVFTHDRMTV
jgi:hypothetical protein